MRAIVYDRYGPPEVLRIEEVERPVPKEDEILVKIHASTVNRSDCAYRAAKPFVSRAFTGLRRPKRRVPGSELAGEVAAVGEDVTEFQVGDRVFGVYPFLNDPRPGAYAEFMAIPEQAPLTQMPASLSFEEAASIPDGAMLALGCLRRVGIRKGMRILIYGASGSIGTAGVQLARHFEAHVTAVCNTKNVELVRSLGADDVIDYTKEDFTNNGQTYEVVFDAVGKHSFKRSRGSLSPGGLYIPTDGFNNVAWALWTWKIGDRRVVWDIPPKYRKKDLVFLKELIDAGKYRPVIDRSYPLEEIHEAVRYVETEQKTGNVILTVAA